MINKIEKIFKQFLCDHKNWDCHSQIRKIKCCKCGKSDWIKEYKNLYKK